VYVCIYRAPRTHPLSRERLSDAENLNAGRRSSGIVPARLNRLNGGKRGEIWSLISRDVGSTKAEVTGSGPPDGGSRNRPLKRQKMLLSSLRSFPIEIKWNGISNIEISRLIVSLQRSHVPRDHSASNPNLTHPFAWSAVV